MNKYQKALDELSYPLDDSSCGGCKCGESDCHCKKRTAVVTLQELVDKATPKKPVDYKCPVCGNRVIDGFIRDNICRKCFQRIDWSEEG